jgi:hypothetical protein
MGVVVTGNLDWLYGVVYVGSCKKMFCFLLLYHRYIIIIHSIVFGVDAVTLRAGQSWKTKDTQRQSERG